MTTERANAAKCSQLVSQIVLWAHGGLALVVLPYLVFAPFVVVAVAIELAVVVPLALLMRKGHGLAGIPLGAWLFLLAALIWSRNRPGPGEITDTGHYLALGLAGALAILGLATVGCAARWVTFALRR